MAFGSTISTVKARTINFAIIGKVLVIVGIIAKRKGSFNCDPISSLEETVRKVGYCFVEVEVPLGACCSCCRCSFLRANSSATVTSWAVAWFILRRCFVRFNPAESKVVGLVVIEDLFLWLEFKLEIIASKQNLTTSVS